MSWDAEVERLIDEAQRGEPRAESYWAQQLAFAPVVVHAVRLRLRDEHLGSEERSALARVARLASAALGPLPDARGTDPALLALFAARQARAIAWGRRGTLARLLCDLRSDDTEGPSLDAPSAATNDAARLLRPYPLIGWRPGERLAG